MSLISFRKTTRKWGYKTCRNEVKQFGLCRRKSYLPDLLQAFQYVSKIVGSIQAACVTCLDIQKTSEIPHKKLLRKLSTGGDVKSWIRNWLRVCQQSLGVKEQFQCDKSTGMRFLVLNDPKR